jgi:hypothetical protein
MVMHVHGAMMALVNQSTRPVVVTAVGATNSKISDHIILEECDLPLTCKHGEGFRYYAAFDSDGIPELVVEWHWLDSAETIRTRRINLMP